MSSECRQCGSDTIKYVAELDKRIAELEAKVETYRHANDSKAARIQKMKEQYEEDARNRKQHITGLKEELDGMLSVNDNANRCIAELEETISQLSKADASLRAQNEAQERNAVASAKRIAELEDTIGRYEAELLNINHVCISNFSDHSGQKLSVALEECIAELKEQLPKLVTPRFTGTLGHKTCACGNSVRVAARYCSNCGSKLNWEDARC